MDFWSGNKSEFQWRLYNIWEGIMKNPIRIYKIASIILSISVLILAITTIISGFDNTQVITFACMVAVLCTNLALYSSQKKKDNAAKTKDEGQDGKK